MQEVKLWIYQRLGRRYKHGAITVILTRVGYALLLCDIFFSLFGRISENMDNTNYSLHFGEFFEPKYTSNVGLSILCMAFVLNENS